MAHVSSFGETFQANASRRFAILIAVSLLAGCSKPYVEQTLAWTSAPEQSFVHTQTIGATDFIQRCWRRGPSYNCLSVGSFHSDGAAMIYALRYDAASLPKTFAESAPTSGNGYLCVYYPSTDVLTETISKNGNVVTSNNFNRTAPNSSDSLWSKEHVQGYASDNAIQPSTEYFNCAAPVNAVKGGSLSSIGTTSLTLDSLG